MEKVINTVETGVISMHLLTVLLSIESKLRHVYLTNMLCT